MATSSQHNESALYRSIMLRATALGARLFRNQVGRYHLADGRWLSSGLSPGSSDLIGWVPVTITPEMVGRQIAVFTAIECKAAKGPIPQHQADFIQAVRSAGGIAAAVWSEQEASRVLRTLGQIAPRPAGQ